MTNQSKDRPKDERPELLPCPFCGGDANIATNCIQFDGRALRTINCSSCQASMSGNEPELVTAWNTRTTAPEGFALVRGTPTDEEWWENEKSKAEKRFAARLAASVEGEYD